MRSQFPTSLEQDEILDYIYYLIFVGGIFVGVAVILYITVIVLAIASRKCKCLSTELIAKYHELHASKAHFWFIVTVVAVSLLVIASVIFGLVENTRLHHRIVSIAEHPTTVFTPTTQVVLDVNTTVRETSYQLDEAIFLVENVLDSVSEITEAITNINSAILDVQEQFKDLQDQALSARDSLKQTSNSLDTLNKYQDEGYINGVPDTERVNSVDDTINDTLSTANDYLDSTVSTFTKVLIQVNTTIDDAVDIGKTQVDRAKNVLRKQINDLHGKLGSAVVSLQSPNATISRVSKTVIGYEDIRHTVIIVLVVVGVLPLIFIFVGLLAKIPILYKFSFALAFFFMFWLIAFGGVFTIVHTAFSQACESREEIVINVIHKFAPPEYRVNLGNINIGGGSNSSENTVVVISLNTSTLHELLTCNDPRNFFDVFGLENLMNSIFGQIYKQLDDLEAQQLKLFDTSTFLPDTMNGHIDSTLTDVTKFDNTAKPVYTGEVFRPLSDVSNQMPNITTQTQGIPEKVNLTVQESIVGLNILTNNVTTEQGDSFSYFYTLLNYTELDPEEYPYNQTPQEFQNQLSSAKEAVESAVSAQASVTQTVSAITDATASIAKNIDDIQDLFTRLNYSNSLSDSVDTILNELDRVQSVLPEMADNITLALSSIRNVLDHVNNNLRSDTQCGFAGDFYETLTDEICVTSTSNARAMAAALLLMGISYFLVCLLGVTLLKRHDMHRLMHLTERGLQKIASMKVVTQTKLAVNAVVRATSSIIRPSRESSSSDLSSESSDHQPVSPIDENYRVLDHVYSPPSSSASSAATSPESVSSTQAMINNSNNRNSPRTQPPRSPRFAPSPLHLSGDTQDNKKLERSGSMVQVIKEGIHRGSTSLARSLGVSNELSGYTELQNSENNTSNSEDRQNIPFGMGLDSDLAIVEMDELRGSTEDNPDTPPKNNRL